MRVCVCVCVCVYGEVAVIAAFPYISLCGAQYWMAGSQKLEHLHSNGFDLIIVRKWEAYQFEQDKKLVMDITYLLLLTKNN